MSVSTKKVTKVVFKRNPKNFREWILVDAQSTNWWDQMPAVRFIHFHKDSGLPIEQSEKPNPKRFSMKNRAALLSERFEYFRDDNEPFTIGYTHFDKTVFFQVDDKAFRSRKTVNFFAGSPNLGE